MSNFKDMARDGTVKRADIGMKMKLEDIHADPGFNVRFETNELAEHIASLKAFILGGGSVPPLEVRPRDEGGAYVVDGHCRLEAFQQAKAEGAPIEWISIMPFNGNDADRVARMATSNEGLKLKPLELSVVYKRLRGMGLEMPEIAKLVNKTPQHVGQILTLADANTDVQQAVKDGDISPTEAVKVVKEHGDKAGEVIKTLKQKTGGKRVTAAVTGKGMKLTNKEGRVLDTFIGKHHKLWKEVCEGMGMDDEERKNLEARLADMVE